MIFLRTYGADQSVGVSNYVSIAQPVGVQDGDLLLVGICLTDSSIDVAPPDDDWTLVARTDETRTGNVAVFYKFAQNEPSRWVFTLSSTAHPLGTYGVGGVLVYGGADGFEPVETSAAATSPSALTQNVPAITASEDGEELVLFLGADNAGTFTPLTGYQVVVKRAPGGVGTFEAHHRQLESAGTQPAATIPISVLAKGACVAIALRPSMGTMSVDDVRERIVAALPPGVDDVYDLTPTGDYYKYFQAIASWMKTYAFDLVDILRREIAPQFSRYKLPSWERIFGLETTHIAQSGTIPQRQAQVVSSWRAAAGRGASVPVVQGVLGPLLGYFPSTPVEVIECDRSALTLAHSYDVTAGADVTIPGSSGVVLKIPVLSDGGKVAKCGAMLNLAFSAATNMLALVFTLTAPDGTTSKIWGGTAAAPLVLYGPELAGADIYGTWTLEIDNLGGGSATLYSGSTLFVEGIAPRQQTAGAIFEWGVYADPAHLGENGTPANFDAARREIKKLTFSHCIGGLIQSLDAIPDDTAIPDECLPD